MKSAKHILICDVNIKQQGHYIGYNQYILDNIEKEEKKDPNFTYSFLYNREAETLLTFNAFTKNKVSFIDDNGWSNPTTGGKIKLFKKLAEFGNHARIDHMIFMDLDQYQLPIFFAKCNFTISGVLFRPHHRIIASNSSLKAKFRSLIQRSKKIIAEKFLLKNKSTSKIFILNDETGVAKLNKFHRSTQFTYLPDPIFSYPSNLNSLRENQVFKFLVFGAINERKNITAILKSYDLAKFSVKTELIIAGSGQEAYLTYLDELITGFKNITPDKSIKIKAGFVSNEEMDNLFDSCDVCLLIYKDFYGSSGLLGRSALHKKKVIGSNVGLLKELIEANNLGLTCDPNSIDDISYTLVKSIELKSDNSAFEKFYQQYSPENFLTTLTKTI